MKKTFEVKETKRPKLPDSSIVHAESRIGDSAIILSEALANSICLEVCKIEAILKNCPIRGNYLKLFLLKLLCIECLPFIPIERSNILPIE